MNFTKSLFLLLLILASISFAQKKSESHKNVFVDASGVLRWEGSNEEVSLFGVNYTTPFAYSYRAQKKLGLSLKKAIDLDVDQMARLGLDAFRVHVWDREISDKAGNIFNKEHLNLFDYLLARLESKGIKIILTPIAWWGNGWPEPDEKTKGFSQFYSKVELITRPDARKAERNYLKQFVNHYNPYTKLSYRNDPSIIAMEIINEPFHPDSGKEVTDYINEMVKTIRNAGYSKPLFYNISQNWNVVQAQAVCNANIQGVSFQWYPTGLVHNKMLHGNYLINVNHYSIPSESLTGYNNKAKMVYEFEAADIGASYMYPAMVRSFREAGMQFAAMFAYEPVQIAWSNTEYPTHYLNLLYTPSKAISLMIAAKAFHILPRMKSYGDYPENNHFGDFRVDYNEDLSEMNSDTAFLYSNTTKDIPKDVNSVRHIAGCGNSFLVEYDGTGAYFLDKLQNGIWKLEVYPDVMWLRDPFEPTSMSRQVARLFWNERKMNLSIHDLGKDFQINSLSGSNHAVIRAAQSGFTIKPGIYLLASKSALQNDIKKYSNGKEEFLNGLYTPPGKSYPAYVVNNSRQYSFESGPVEFKFNIASDKKIINAVMYIKRLGWRGFEKDTLIHGDGFNYYFKDASKKLTSGELEYCVAVNVEEKQYTFPGTIPDSPDKWDFFTKKYWNMKIVPNDEPLVLFNPLRDRENLVFPQWSRSMRFFADYKSGTNSDNNALSVAITFNGTDKIPFGMQLNVSDLLKSFNNNFDDYNYVVLKARSTSDSGSTIGINFLTMDGKSFGSSVKLDKNWNEIKIPVASFKKNSSLILPFSYPQFLAKFWSPADENESEHLDLNDLNCMQITCQPAEQNKSGSKSETGFEIESVKLEKIIH